MSAKRPNPTSGQQTSHSPKILIVDDNEINVKVLAAYLKPMNVETIVAHNGQNALQVLEKQTVDLIFMDLHMPIMNGYQTTETIRSQKSNNQAIPIIGITADGLQESIQKCMQSGMNHYLIKPIIHKDIEEILRTWLFKHTNSAQKSATQTNDLNNMMIRELPTYKKQLETALKKTDYETLYLVSHKINGGSAYCTLPDLNKDAMSLQTAAKIRNETLVKKNTRQLLSTIDQILKNKSG